MALLYTQSILYSGRTAQMTGDVFEALPQSKELVLTLLRLWINARCSFCLHVGQIVSNVVVVFLHGECQGPIPEKGKNLFFNIFYFLPFLCCICSPLIWILDEAYFKAIIFHPYFLNFYS